MGKKDGRVVMNNDSGINSQFGLVLGERSF